MVVDMVRDDLGRIATPGSVRVSRLFDIETYPSIYQMTSTVEATTDADPIDVLRALFPSASITGAPKVRAMEIIQRLESTPRGSYTGAIGFIGPDRQAQFNVAIRTATIDRQTRRVRNRRRHRLGLEIGVGVGGVSGQGEHPAC
jgi:para-aminobenzoate synthetase/4-amino-4-deoxychorismate lyase